MNCRPGEPLVTPREAEVASTRTGRYRALRSPIVNVVFDRDLDLALRCSDLAGSLALDWFGHDLRPEFKADGSVVTAADHAVAIRSTALRPAYGETVGGGCMTFFMPMATSWWPSSLHQRSVAETHCEHDRHA